MDSFADNSNRDETEHLKTPSLGLTVIDHLLLLSIHLQLYQEWRKSLSKQKAGYNPSERICLGSLEKVNDVSD